MATSLWYLLKEYKVVIPIVQRDYAQGRQTGKVPIIRERFLNAVYNAVAVNKEPLELDFVYGYTKENKNDSSKTKSNFIPLDGQQRLTTLFLLHWYIAAKENHIAEAKDYLTNFTYETRHSSRVFCNELIKFTPEDMSTPIGKTIVDQPWFFTAWRNDPTIDSMLVMLNSIQEKFGGEESVWGKLTSEQPKIVFHLLPMDKLGLPDDLYIKMNSRGKELTDFEHFKSRFSETLNQENANIFNTKIDQEWSDLFWSLHKSKTDLDIAILVDNAFLRFFQYITDIIITKNDIDISNEIDNFSNYKNVYCNSENVNFLFSCLNTFSNLYLKNPSFFETIFYTDTLSFDENRTRLFFQNASTDLFKKCVNSYDTTQRINPFSIGEQLLLYGCLVHFNENTTDFNNRIRKLRNLIANSEDTVRKENMKSLLHTVSVIILNDSIDDESKFNKTQTKEESDKEVFIANNSSLRGIIHKLEDHHLLQGCIAAFKLDEQLENYANAFLKEFTYDCNYEALGIALLTFGDYSQEYGKFNRFGNNNESVWRELFTPSQRRLGFEHTKSALYSLLSHFTIDRQLELEKISSDYLTNHKDKPKDWSYYFIKYREFRQNHDGYYYWPDRRNRFECFMMRKSTMGGFHWSPFLYTIKEYSKHQLSLDNYGHPLILAIGNVSIRLLNINQGYRLEAFDEEGLTFLQMIQRKGVIDNHGICLIAQDDNGSDLEDRIEKGINLIEKIFLQ